MSILLNTAKNNIFFQDFIAFLNEIEKEPLELTATRNGNIKVKEIKRLGELFKHDIYHRDDQGNVMFATRTEDDFPYIWLHKQIAKVMYLIYTRNQKIKLSKNGKAFLHNIEADIQFQEVIRWYFHRADWRYTNWHRSEIVKQLQQKQLSIWVLLLELNGSWISSDDFCTFLKNIIPDLALAKMQDQPAYSEYRSMCRVISKAILGMLDSFDLIDTEKVSEKYGGSKIVRFKLNQAGELMLMKAMIPL